MTKRGIYKDLRFSDYTVWAEGYTFYFSSTVYCDKFLNAIDDEIVRFNKAINVIYKNPFPLDLKLLAIIRYYIKIETRGFYIINDQGETITCPKSLNFDLRIKTAQN